jgi:hypothetical protein
MMHWSYGLLYGTIHNGCIDDLIIILRQLRNARLLIFLEKVNGIDKMNTKCISLWAIIFILNALLMLYAFNKINTETHLDLRIPWHAFVIMIINLQVS